ncbi:50S ribosomal protein L30e-like protein [Massariosphaeria phaeospora]|uniref:50S ribosomal protein L30e-like protein n=1 Tax=Massariosphaeria phaeospora TaxID=100035 RepID=A0A7C8I8Q3_9PLEO|nr:50S ribosomal protein L30e-like protein [Massariosphaeria phaeospora]
MAEKKIKKEKKEKKEKRAEVDGVVKVKKEKKAKISGDIADALEAELEKSPETSMVKKIDSSGDTIMGEEALRDALVPFAFPLAEDTKDVKKILRTVKKSAKSKTLRRGVKEVVKALRKSQVTGPANSDISNATAIVIIAADISPMDVISHLPVLCEDHSVPYVYVKSRAELGEASATKRPTSVVMVSKERTSKKAKEISKDDASEFDDAYAELLKLVVKASHSVRK